ASVHHEESRRPALPWAPRQSACAAEPRQYKREGIVRPALRFTRPASLDGVGSSGRTHATRCAGCARAHGAQASLVAMGILFLMLAALFLLPMLRLCSRFLAGGFSRGLMIDTSLVMLGSRHRPGSHQHPGKNKTDHLFHEVSPLLGAAKAARYTALLSAATRPTRLGLSIAISIPLIAQRGPAFMFHIRLVAAVAQFSLRGIGGLVFPSGQLGTLLGFPGGIVDALSHSHRAIAGRPINRAGILHDGGLRIYLALRHRAHRQQRRHAASQALQIAPHSTPPRFIQLGSSPARE